MSESSFGGDRVKDIPLGQSELLPEHPVRDEPLEVGPVPAVAQSDEDRLKEILREQAFEDAKDKRPEFQVYRYQRQMSFGKVDLAITVRNRRIFPKGRVSAVERFHEMCSEPTSGLLEFKVAAEKYIHRVQFMLNGRQVTVPLSVFAIFNDTGDRASNVGFSCDSRLRRVSLAFRGGDGGGTYNAGTRVRNGRMEALVLHAHQDVIVDLNKLADAVLSSPEKGALLWSNPYGGK